MQIFERYVLNQGKPIAKILASVFVLMLLGTYVLPVFADFQPGETLDPNCLPSDPSCTVVFASSTAAVWGSITGTLSDQSDLMAVLNSKLSTTTAASVYLPIASSTGFLSTTTAASTYLSIANAAAQYLTLSAWFGTTTDGLAQGTTNRYFSDALARNAIQSNVAALTYATSTGIFSLTSGFSIPTSASTTNWNIAYDTVAASSTAWDAFYGTPSTRITAGTGLSWSGNTLNAIGGGGSGTVNSGTLGQVAFYAASGTAVSGTSSITLTGAGLGFTGTSTFNGNVIPGSAGLSLGTLENPWHDLYVSSSSIYINGQKVLSTDPSQNVNITADINQSLKLSTFGTGDIEFNPTGSGVIALKANVQLSGGKTIRSSDLSPLLFTDGIQAGNVNIWDNSIQAANLNGGLSLMATGTGNVYVTQGNFGIGTTTPGSKLTVTGNSFVTGTSTAACFTTNGTTCITSNAQWSISGSDIYYNTGNVGIGSSSPSAMLTLAGAANAPEILLQETAGNGTVRITANGGSGFRPSIGTVTNHPFAIVTGSSTRLVVGASGGLSLGNTFFGTDAGANNFIVEGNVGIGTTTVSRALTISGAAYISGTTTSGCFSTNGVTCITGGSPAGSSGQIQYNNGSSFAASSNLSWDNVNSTLTINGTTTATCFSNDGGATCIAPNGGSGTVNAGTAGYFAYYPSTGSAVSSQNGLFWDAANSRVGIGTSTPGALLSVGTSSQFQVNALGAIAAVTGITTTGGYTQTGSGSNIFSGNVGIGTSTLTDSLSIYRTNSSSRGSVIRLGSDGGSGTYVGFDLAPLNSRGVAAAAIRGVDDGNFGAYLSFFTETGNTGGTTERLRISSSGNVGIGTTNPTSKLTVSGSGYFTGDVTVVGTTTSSCFSTDGITCFNLSQGIPGGTDGYLQFNEGGGFGATSSLFWNNSAGRLGIGTSTPGEIVDIVGGNVRVQGPYGYTWADNPGGGSGDTAWIKYFSESGEDTQLQIGVANDSTDDIAFYQNGANRMVIYNGNVGIGTTTPGATLTLVGNAYIGGNSTTTGNSLFQGNLSVSGTSTLANVLLSGITGSNQCLQVDSSGHIVGTGSGCATASSTPVGSDGYVQFTTAGAFNGTSSLFWDNANARLGIGSTTPSNSLSVGGTFGVTGASVFNGNVGIGDFNPSSKLSVVGTSNFTGTVNVSTSASDAFGSVHIQSSVAPVMPLDYDNYGDAKGLVINAYSRDSWSGYNRVVDFAALGSETSTGSMFRFLNQGNNDGALTERMRIATNGNVGIGTINPGTLLTVAGTTTVGQVIISGLTGSNQCLQIDTDGVVTGTGSGCAGGGSAPGGSTGAFQFNDSGILGGSSELYWDSVNSRVGVGTTTPSRLFSVAGDTLFTGNNRINGTLGVGMDVSQGQVSIGAANQGGLGGDLWLFNTNGSSVANSAARLAFSTDSSTDSTPNAEIRAIQNGLSGSSADLTFTTWNGATMVEGLRVRSNGNIGIGTTTPGSLLTVAGTVAAGCFSTDGGNTCITGSGGSGTVNSGTAGQVAFYAANGTTVSGTSTLFLTGGKVGIGTTTPDSKLVIDSGTDSTGFMLSGSATGYNWSGRIVAGGASAKFLLGQYNDQAWIGAHNGNLTAWQDIYLNPDGDKNVYIGDSGPGGGAVPPTPILTVVNTGGTGAGNVGIGTTTPSSKLTIAGTTTATCFSVDGGATCLSSGGGSGTVNSGTLGQVAFYGANGTAVSGTSTLFFNGTNIGIGTTTPESKLSIWGTTTISAVSDGGARLIFRDASTPSSESRGGEIYGSWGANALIMDTLQGDSAAHMYLGTSNGYLDYQHFYTNGLERMSIIQNGNVGVGTTSPDSKFTVQGSSHFVGNMTLENLAGESTLFLPDNSGSGGRGGLVRGTWGGNGLSLDTMPGDGATHIYYGSDGYVNNHHFYVDGVERMTLTSGGSNLILTPQTNSTMILGQNSGATGYNILSLNGNRSNTGFLGMTGGGTGDNNLYLAHPSGSGSVYLGSAGSYEMELKSSGVLALTGLAGGGDQCLRANNAGEIEATGSDCGGGSSQWTTTGSDIYYNTGNVGIGTNAPTNYTNYASLALNNAIGGGLIEFQSNGTDAAIIYGNNTGLNIDAQGSRDIRFHTNSAEVMRIEDDGKVGIGTNSPVSKLNVLGNLSVTGSSTQGTSFSQGGVYIGAGPNGAKALEFVQSSEAGSDGVVIDFSQPSTDFIGRMGYDFNSAIMYWATDGGNGSMQLDGSGNLKLNSLAGGGNQCLRADNDGVISTTGSDCGGGGGSGTVNSGLAGQMAFYGANGTAVSGTSTLFALNEKIGIGTTNPLAKLDVLLGARGGMLFPYESAIFERDDDNKIGIYNSKSSPAGTGASLTLGYTNYTNTNGNYPGFEIQNWVTGTAIAQNSLRFNSLERNSAGAVTGAVVDILSLSGNGNVGIGTSSPAAKLQVQGDIVLGGDGSTNKYYYGVAAGAKDTNWSTGLASGGSLLTNGALTHTVYGGGAGYGFMVKNSSGTSLFEIQGSNGQIRIPTLAGGGDQCLRIDNDGDLTPTGSDCGAGGSSQWGDTGSDIFFDTGNVGIGTDSPYEALDVKVATAGTNGESNVAVFGTDSWNDGETKNIVFGGNNGTLEVARFGGFAEGGSSRQIRFDVHNGTSWVNNILVLDSTGNVGIGSTSPAHALTVYGDPSASLGNSLVSFVSSAPTVDNVFSVKTGAVDMTMIANVTGGNVAGIVGTQSNHPLNFRTNGGDVGRFGTNGSLGIGTTSTAYPLTIGTSTAAIANGEKINLSANAFLSTYTSGLYTSSGSQLRSNGSWLANSTTAATIQINDQNSGGFSFIGDTGLTPGNTFSPTELMVILSSGNVGIGTTTPATKLSVIGTSTLQNLILSGAGTTGSTQCLRVNSLGVVSGTGSDCGAGGGSPGGSNGQIQFNNAGSFDGSSDLFWDAINGRLGIGSSTPYATLSVAGSAIFSDFSTLSTTTTSYVAGNFDVGNGAIQYDNATGITAISNLQLGALNFETDAGVVSWADLPLTASSTIGTIQSYTAQIAGLPVLSVYGISDGAGSATNLAVGIGTTTPSSTLTVAGTVAFNGLNTSASGDDAVCISPSGEIRIAVGAADCTTSSKRFKHDIETLTATSGLAMVNQLRPVSFKMNGTNEEHLGFVAEEVALLDPRLTFTEADGTTTRGIRYQEMTAVLAKAVQELNLKVDTLASSTGTSSALVANGSLTTDISAAVSNALSSMTEWVGQKITVVIGSFRKVQVERGLEIKDQATGDIYCVEIKNGDWVKTKGVCVDTQATPTVENTTNTTNTNDTTETTTGTTTATTTDSTESTDSTATSTQATTTDSVATTTPNESTATTTADVAPTTSSSNDTGSTTPQVEIQSEPETTTQIPASETETNSDTTVTVSAPESTSAADSGTTVESSASESVSATETVTQ